MAAACFDMIKAQAMYDGVYWNSTGIARANKTLRNVSEAWVQSQKVIVTKGKITGYRVILKITFVLDD